MMMMMMMMMKGPPERMMMMMMKGPPERRMMMLMMIWCFTSLLTLFKSYQDDGRMIMKGSLQ